MRFIADEQVAYVACRLREVHDIWHVLFKCGTNIYGEAALKWIEMMQTGMPMTALSAGITTRDSGGDDDDDMLTGWRPNSGHDKARGFGWILKLLFCSWKRLQ